MPPSKVCKARSALIELHKSCGGLISHAHPCRSSPPLSGEDSCSANPFADFAYALRLENLYNTFLCVALRAQTRGLQHICVMAACKYRDDTTLMCPVVLLSLASN